MSFKKLEITKKGRELLSKVGAGERLKFTKVEFGDGESSLTNFEELEALVSKKISSENPEVKVGREKVTVTTSFKNSEEGFFWKEIGVFATVDEDLENQILFAYQNARNLAEFIPSTTSELVEKLISIDFKFDAAATVKIAVNDSMVYATKEELVKDTEQIYEILLKKVEKTELLDLVYPIGSIYFSDGINPQNDFGGIWEKIEGAFIMASKDSHGLSSGSKGGNPIKDKKIEIKLKPEQLPLKFRTEQDGGRLPSEIIEKLDEAKMSIDITPQYVCLDVWMRVG